MAQTVKTKEEILQELAAARANSAASPSVIPVPVEAPPGKGQKVNVELTGDIVPLLRELAKAEDLSISRFLRGLVRAEAERRKAAKYSGAPR